MVRRRRRPLRRAAMVGGTVDGTGLKAQREREQALQAPAGGVSEAATDQLEQLQESGVLTQDELDDRDAETSAGSLSVASPVASARSAS